MRRPPNQPSLPIRPSVTPQPAHESRPPASWQAGSVRHKMQVRIPVLVSAGAALLVIGHFALPRAFELWLMPREPKPRVYSISPSESEERAGLAPLRFWTEAAPGEKGDWRIQNAARILLIRGQAFVGDVLIPREEIREYLNARVKQDQIEYVIVFPAKESKWGDLFPVLDECRKSRVRVVFLNRFES